MDNEKKEMSGVIEYKGRKYELAFNLNVMQEIQKEYGSLAKWVDKTDTVDGEPNVEAVIFGFCAMLNEGIDIHNEDIGESVPMVSLKTAGRMLTEIGFDSAAEIMQSVVIKSSETDEKNV